MLRRIVYAGEGCTGCKICTVACAHAHEGTFSLSAGRIWVIKKEPDIDFPVVCYQCAKAPCQEICPQAAIHREDGVLLVDEDLCIGCGACVEACPFGAITLHPKRGVAIKCDACIKTSCTKPACVSSCPAGVLKLQTPSEIAHDKRARRG